MNINIKNPRIINFFKNNSNIDIELFLLQNINFYEFVISNIDNNTSHDVILPYILTQTNMINNLIEDNRLVKLKLENIDSSRIDQQNTLKDIQHSFKDFEHIICNNKLEYFNNIKTLLSELEHSVHSNKDITHIFTHFDKRLLENHHQLIQSTKDTLTSIKLDNHKDLLTLSKDIELFTTKSFNDIKQHLSILKEHSPKEFLPYFDKILSEVKQNNNINLLSSEFNNIRLSLDDTKNTVTHLSHKFLNTSNKGRISENILESALSQKFPSYSIKRTTHDPHSGDFILSSPHKPSILLENKDYTSNVSTDEVQKFIRDLHTNQLSGILISQNSGISNKQNFSIEFFDNNVALYIHNCNYDMDQIQLAIDIIYSLLEFISSHSNHSLSHSIDQNTFTQIQSEYLEFIQNRNDTITQLHSCIKNIKKLDLSSIKGLLDKHSNILSTIKNNTFTCHICRKSFKSSNSFSAHVRKIHV